MTERQALLLINPNSRSGAGGAEALTTRLRQGGLGVIQVAPNGPDNIAAAIREHRQRIDRVIVGGGDGTVNAALPGVAASGLPMGVLPLGTANDFARSLGVPLEPLAACDVIAADHVRRIDLGECNGRYFVNVAHIGFAVEIARRSDGDTKKLMGPLAYPYAAWTAFRTRRRFTAEIRGDDGPWRRLRAIQVSVGNGRFYGGGIPIAEDAAIDDGRLDLYAIPAHRDGSLLAMIPALRVGRTREHGQIETLAASRIEVRTRQPKTIAVDGEPGGKTPASFRVHPGLLAVYAPPVD
ncbi:lipid kinase [Spectribacter hydrogenoxidans]|uniref:Lipid kinase n=1 Tax=Spectribacter hydrogenoxidans TaxID=3075608 RepID=A0ABU3BXG0_9GAMM|nr:lipid kinase [Salinisphaera sp. W335]MDT0633999.1 lipid kinase [Salinisphaera sp. W335]